VVLYREEVSRLFSEHMYVHLQESLGVQGRGIRTANLYVCRGTWAPHTLIEMGFINNPFDYEWLINNAEQDKLVRAVAEGIVGYFR
jgi:N-acetylmuramoyl-L-alanine amidase